MYAADGALEELDIGFGQEPDLPSLLLWVTPITPWVPGLPSSVKHKALRNLESESDFSVYNEIRHILESYIQSRLEDVLSPSPKVAHDERYASLDPYCPLLQRVDVIGIIAGPQIAVLCAAEVSLEGS